MGWNGRPSPSSPPWTIDNVDIGHSRSVVVRVVALLSSPLHLIVSQMNALMNRTYITHVWFALHAEEGGKTPWNDVSGVLYY